MRTSPLAAAVLRLTVPRAPGVVGLAAYWQPVVVWGLWAAAVWWTGAFVAQYGYNLPFMDEWEFVHIGYASLAEELRWAFEPHDVHRFVLGRTVYLCLMHLTGHDYRAGMWVTVGLLAATAAVLVLAARRLRGRTVLADAAYPLLFLHAAHTENLLMGYQIVFTITVFVLALFALTVAASADAPPGRSAVRGAGCLLVAAAGGWLGLLFVPAIGAWVGWQAWRASGDPVRRWAAVAVIAAVGAYLGWSACSLPELRAAADARLKVWGIASAGSMEMSRRVRAVFEVTGIGFGVGILQWVGLTTAGVAVVAAQLATAAALLRVAVRHREERAVALGLVALLIGVWLFALSIGYGRGNGLASRYTTLTAVGIALPLLALARYARWSAWPVVALVVLFGAFVLPANGQRGANQGARFLGYYRRVADDVRTGMPLDVLAPRHVHFWAGPPECWTALWRNRFSVVRDVPAPATGERPGTPATFARDGEVVENRVAYDRYRVDLGGEREVSFVRVTFAPRVMSSWEPLVFAWTDPRTGERKRDVLKLRLRPVEQSIVFWIDGPLAAGELIMGREGCRFEVKAVEYGRIPRE